MDVSDLKKGNCSGTVDVYLRECCGPVSEKHPFLLIKHLLYRSMSLIKDHFSDWPLR